LEEKAGKKNLTPAIASVFQGPLRPKKQAWFFFLDKIAGQEKRTKKETLVKNRQNKTGKKNPGRGECAGYSFIGQRY